MIRTLLLTFIPLFVAVDVVAVVFVYLGIGMPLDEAARRRLVLEATMTAAAIGLGFLLVGDAVLHVLGVTAGDFQAAGGVLLLVLSSTISSIPNYHRQPGAHLGVVPLGIPMIVGPATLTTLLTIMGMPRDRKSTRLNSSHVANSYAVFCLRKKIDHK